MDLRGPGTSRSGAQPIQGITLAKQYRKRRTSLFEPDRPLPNNYDPGVSVLTHADFPARAPRSRPLPVQTTQPIKHQLPGEFDVSQITSIIREVLENGLSGKKYNVKDCGPATRELVHTLKEKVSGLEIPGYKLVCTCCVTKRVSPAPAVESGCAWDECATSISRDRFAEYIYRKDDLLAVGTVYGVYSKKVTGKSRRSSKLNVKDMVVHSPIPEF